MDRVDRQTIGYGRCGCATFWLSVTRQTGASEKRSWSTRSQSRRGPNTADSFCRRIHGFPTRDATAKNPSCCPNSLVLFENFTVVVCVAWRCLEVLAVVVVLGVVGLSDPTHTAAHHTNWRKKKRPIWENTPANERTNGRTRDETHEKKETKRKSRITVQKTKADQEPTHRTAPCTSTRNNDHNNNNNNNDDDKNYNIRHLPSFLHSTQTDQRHCTDSKASATTTQSKGPNVGAFTQSINQSVSQSVTNCLIQSLNDNNHAIDRNEASS